MSQPGSAVAAVEIVVLVLCMGGPARAADEVWNLRGTLGGRLRIEMELDGSSSSMCDLCGSYRYEGKKARLVLSGSLDADGTATLEEVDPATGDTTGSFEDKLTSGRFTGTWQDAKHVKKLSFDLASAPAPPVNANRVWTGSWTLVDAPQGMNADIMLRGLPDGQVRAGGFATREVGTVGGSPYANIGQFHGIGTVAAGVLQLRDADYVECRLTLRMAGGTLRVEDSSGACGGAGVSFDGAYSGPH